MADFIQGQLDYILFVYGAGLVLLGITSILLSVHRRSHLPWRWLAAFGFIQGLAVWQVMLLAWYEDLGVADWFRVVLLLTANVCLLEFARQGWRITGHRTPGRWVFAPLIALVGLGLVVGGSAGCEAMVHYAFTLAGGLWTAAVFWVERTRIPHGRRALAVAAWAAGAYGVVMGLFPPRAGFFPASSFNAETIGRSLGEVPVEIIELVPAMVLAFAVWTLYRARVRAETPPRRHRVLLRYEAKVVGCLILIFVGGWLLTAELGLQANEREREQLQHTAFLTASALDPMDVARVTGGRLENSDPDYLHLRSQLLNMSGAAQNVDHVILMTERGGEVLVAVDSLPVGRSDHAEPGTPVDRSSTSLAGLFASGGGLTVGPITEPGGTFLAAYATVVDKASGRVLGVLGVQTTAEEVNEIMASRLPGIVGTLLVATMLVIFILLRDRLQLSTERLTESENRLGTVSRATVDAIVMIDNGGKVSFWNPGAERMFGYSEAEMLGRDLHETVTPAEYHDAQRDAFAGFAADGGGAALGRVTESVGLRRDGSCFPVELSLAPVWSNESWCAVGVVRDVTARQQAQEELRQARDTLEAIIAASPVAIVTLDLEERVQQWNPAAERIFGWTEAEIRGAVIPWVHPEAREEAEELAQSWRAGGSAHGVEIRRMCRDGRVVDLAFFSAPLHDAHGSIVGDTGLMMDITERKRAERELRSAKEQTDAVNRELESAIERANQLAVEAQVANAAKSEFLANMSHEIRTPMNGVLGMIDLLLITHLDAEQRDFAETARASADALLTVINDVLDYSKIEARRMVMERLDFDLRMLLESMMDVLALRAQDKGLEVTTLIHPDVPATVCGDPGRLRQVLTNLIGNAVKFTEHGEVALEVGVASVDEQTAMLKFSVRDTGIGLANDQREALFQPFTQADASTTRQFGGTGLGLSISRQLVELMHGQIDVDSAPGQGSTFWFTARFDRPTHDSIARLMTDLPRSGMRGLGLEDGAPAADTVAPLPGGLTGVRVLSVDDNPTNRRVVAGLLESWGARHAEVADADEALRELERGLAEGDPYRAAVLDMAMPGVDGEMLGRAIRERPEFDPVALVMMTSLGVRGDAARLAEVGFDAYLTKPVKQPQLYGCLVSVLEMGDAPRSGRAPLITRHSLAEREARIVRREVRPLRILLAEDNVTNQKVAKKSLELLGHQVDVAVNGAEAVESVGRSVYDVVLMDVQMPVMDGFAATALIRAGEAESGGRHLPIIALTAHAMAGDRERCLEAGMDDYLTKPLRMDALVRAIDEWGSGAGPWPVAGGVSWESRSQAPTPAPARAASAVATDPPSSPLGADGVVYDPGVLLGMLGGDEDLAREILAGFLTDAHEQLAALEVIVDTGDAVELQRGAHRMKGAAANVGAVVLAQRAARLEKNVVNDRIEDARVDVSALALALEEFEGAVGQEARS